MEAENTESLDQRIKRLKEVSESERVESDDLLLLDVEAFRKVSTPKRREVIESLRTGDFESQKELAEFLGRDIKNVHEDLELLRRHGVVELKDKGGSTRPLLRHRYIAGETI